ncbi:hypothetical protein [Streptomyces iakyrus]|uniref:hypothetical protein n=1 Tax=Streptomyces iakyrus TaxID=68219 RepID=UPI00368088A0
MSTARANAVVDDYTHQLAEKIRKAWVDHDAQKSGNVCMLSALNAADFIDTKTDSGDDPDEDEGQILDGGHDFQWGHDHVQRCTRCTLPHSRWGGGLCPGPDHPLRPGEYV